LFNRVCRLTHPQVDIGLQSEYSRRIALLLHLLPSSPPWRSSVASCNPRQVRSIKASWKTLSRTSLSIAMAIKP
jgi:hypothetical protein